MERQTSKQASLFMLILVSGLLSQNFVIHAMSIAFEDQKNYYPPDPNAGSPPGGSHHHTPSHEPPSHGSGGRPPHGGNCSPTPSTGHGGGSHGTPPSHGGGGSHGTPPSHGGGGSYDPPTTPPTPSGGGGGYYNSPPPLIVTPPVTIPPVTISPPTTPIGIPGTPSTPIPGISVPSPPFVFDPNTPFTGTCNFWGTHPTIVWGLVGWIGTLGGAFGAPSFPGFTPSLSLPEALTNTRTDGYGALYREGTASLLNSMVNHKFPYTTSHVRDSFVAALGSNRAAAAQAQLFKMANEGRVKPRA